MNEEDLMDDAIEGAIREIADCLTSLVACPLGEISRNQKEDVLKKAQGMLAKINLRYMSRATYPRIGKERQEKFKRDEAMLSGKLAEIFDAYRREQRASAPPADEQHP